jgi:phage gp29-like protein
LGYFRHGVHSTATAYCIKTKTQKIATEQNDQDTGEDYTKLDNIWIVGEPEDLGLLLQCSMYVIYKRGALADWSNFIEIFGQPVRKATYPANDPASKTALEDALNNSGSALALLIPDTAEFDILDGKTGNATGDLQMSFVNFLNQEISITVLGNTETTMAGKNGSNAKSKTQQEQQNQIAKSDMAFLQACLNEPHFIKILQSYGYPVDESGNFEFNKDIDIQFLAERAEVDKTIKEIGTPIGDDYIYETYNIPKPKDYDKLKAEKTAPAPPNPKAKQPEQTELADDDNKPLTKGELKTMLADFFGPAL